MKPSITPIDREIRLGDDEFIVSKTDTKGIITYCNRVFMHIAGYSEAELLGKQHNIVRHPDMPRGVFRFLWQTLQDGEEFFGYVKNMCKSGAYYWVFANVTPDYDERGRIVGYYSVRRKPSDQAIAALAPIYKEMLELEARAGAKDGPDASTRLLQEKLDAMGTTYNDLVMSLDK
ncbi:PAS domain-containing protein [Pontibacterium sp. N1Y112]|uniref:PAS domain-containing protein n=1 Tax=Pontibacterium sinense TaxID=2781979 RepID=A0A8J7FJW6_9GAMM|nr:PAS domain-containing protein [Pontibacterium sinense]MBE9396177.1 PAS domain-containing protein [Pontibacterium sinense]